MIEKSLLKRAGVLLLLLVLVSAGTTIVPAAVPGEGRDGPDLLFLDSSAAFGPRERPPVPFRHDRHTEALAGKDTECTACHAVDGKKRTLRFKGTADLTEKDDLVEIWQHQCGTRARFEAS